MQESRAELFEAMNRAAVAGDWEEYRRLGKREAELAREDIRRTREALDADPRVKAQEAARKLRKAGGAFCTRVELAMREIHHLPEHEARAVAHEVARAVRSVMATMEEYRTVQGTPQEEE